MWRLKSLRESSAHQASPVRHGFCHTGNKRSVPHLPGFPVETCGVNTPHAPFLNEGAHADLSSRARQEIGVKPSFACPGEPRGLLSVAASLTLRIIARVRLQGRFHVRMQLGQNLSKLPYQWENSFILGIA